MQETLDELYFCLHCKFSSEWTFPVRLHSLATFKLIKSLTKQNYLCLFANIAYRQANYNLLHQQYRLLRKVFG